MSGKDSFWFKHDSNARNDIKVVRLRMKHGWAGYGAFFALIECLREERQNRITTDDMEVLLQNMHIEREIFDSIVTAGLLRIAQGYVFSESLDSRMKEWNKLTKKRREAGKLGGSRPKPKANRKQTESKPKANRKQTSSDMTGSDLTGSEETGIDSLLPDDADASPEPVAIKVRKPATTDIQRLWETYEAAIKKRYDIDVTFEKGKTAAILKAVLEGKDLDEARRIVEAYVSLNDQYVIDQCHPLSLIKSKMNLILTKMKQLNSPSSLGPRPTGWPEGTDETYRPRWGSDEAAWLKAKALNDEYHEEQRKKKNAI